MELAAHEFLPAIRALHFGAVMVLFGQFVFLLLVSPHTGTSLNFLRTAAWSLGIAIVTACAWLAVEASAMSGLPMRQALSGGIVSIVLGQTLFGRVWLFRMVVAASACIVLPLAQPPATGPRGTVGPWLGGMLAMLLLVSAAWAGHAVAGQGRERLIHLCADMLHLFAAGAWLGALVPLVMLIYRSERNPAFAALRSVTRATQRFSTLGILSMAAIVVSGIINSMSNVADVAALFGTQYGLLLVTKISLFVLIFVVAAINRSKLLPKLDNGSAGVLEAVPVLNRLRRNVIVEIGLGVGIIAIVGKLGITMPALESHESARLMAQEPMGQPFEDPHRGH